ncbi:hypothetical protein VTO42DRAFT_7833 [Malbranchea cinnamomea]
MQTKHFFTDPTHLVHSALESLTLTNPSLAYDRENKIVYRKPSNDGSSEPKVSIVSGGGSGHEPAFAGFVGKGVLTASVAGTIFASPSAEQVRRAIMRHVETSKGVFVVTMNYTGDVLNFGMATEKAKAAGIAAEFFAIGDDVGVGRAKGGKVGRRGIGGGILVMKIAGALAEAGGSLEDVFRIAKLTSENTVSLGSSLEHVHVPGREIPEDTVPHDEIEVGMGIHNEPGSHRVKATLPELVKIMLAQLLDQNDSDRAFLKWDKSDQFVLFINNLGGVSTLELSGITWEVTKQLERDYTIKPVRTIQGMFLTSLNGLGFSISLLRLVDTGLGPGKSLLDLLDAPAEAVGWTAPIQRSTWENRLESDVVSAKRTEVTTETPSNLHVDTALFKKILTSGLNRLIAAEHLVTRYDTVVGDGDCGSGLKRGAEAVLAAINDPNTLSSDLLVTLNRIIPVVENTMDGTSGAVYAIFLNALAHGLREQDSSSATPVTVQTWSHALQVSLKALGKYTPAQPGDRTLVDALAPFISTLAETGDLAAAAKAAQDGAEATKNMKASLGRSVYVGSEDEWVGKVPDPGAFGLSEFLAGLADAA